MIHRKHMWQDVNDLIDINTGHSGTCHTSLATSVRFKMFQTKKLMKNKALLESKFHAIVKLRSTAASYTSHGSYVI